MINIHVQTEAKCHKRTKTIQGLQTSDSAADLGKLTCQACVRLKEKLAEMEAAKATAEARAPARTPWENTGLYLDKLRHVLKQKPTSGSIGIFYLRSSLFPWESNRINLLPVLLLLLLLFQWMFYHRVASPCLWVVFDWSGSLVKLWVSTDHSACTCQSAKTTLEERLSEKNEAHPQLHDLTRLLDRVLVKAMCTTSASSTLHQCRCMHFSQRKWLSECLQENGDSFQVISDLRRELHKLEVQRLAPRLSSWRMLAVRKCKVQVQ